MKRIGLVVLVVLIAVVGVQASGANAVGGSTDGGDIAATDGDLPIAIQTGPGSGVDTEDSSLVVNAAAGAAEGVPVNAQVTFGDPTNPVETPAFTITNTAEDPIRLGVDYTVSSGDGVGDGASNVELRLYDAQGELVGSTDEETGPASVSVAGDDTISVVVVVDTTVGDLTPDSDLSGRVMVSGS